jgi:hypothetical protein
VELLDLFVESAAEVEELRLGLLVEFDAVELRSQGVLQSAAVDFEGGELGGVGQSADAVGFVAADFADEPTVLTEQVYFKQ